MIRVISGILSVIGCCVVLSGCESLPSIPGLGGNKTSQPANNPLSNRRPIGQSAPAAPVAPAPVPQQQIPSFPTAPDNPISQATPEGFPPQGQGGLPPLVPPPFDPKTGRASSTTPPSFEQEPSEPVLFDGPAPVYDLSDPSQQMKPWEENPEWKEDLPPNPNEELMRSLGW